MSAPTPSAIIAARGTPQNAAHIRLGYAAFNSGQYEEAMMYFQLTEADPLQILSLFPDVLPSGLVAAAGGGGGGVAEDGSGGVVTAPAAFPPSSPFARLRLPPHPVPVHKVQGEDRLFRALSALIPYLAQIQNRLRLSLEPIFAPQQQQQQQQRQQHAQGRGGSGRRRGADGGAADDGTYEDEDDEDFALGSIPTKRKSASSLAAAAAAAAASSPASSAESNLALAILVDTALLKAYLLCDIPLLPHLSSPYNLCDVDECANILRAYEKYVELVAFYRYRARHEQALELLANLGQMSTPKGAIGGGKVPALTPGSSAPAVSPSSSSALAGFSGTEATIKYLQELAVNIHQPCFPMAAHMGQEDGGDTDGDTASTNGHHGLHGHGSTHGHGHGHLSTSSLSSGGVTVPSQFSPASSLDSSPDTVVALILHYSKWPLQVNADDGLRIFTYCHTMNSRSVGSGDGKRGGGGASSHSPQLVGHSAPIIHSYAHHSAHCIPAHIVLDHLKQCADREACIAFLESLIKNVGETASLFHNELIFLYLDSIQKLLRAQEQREQTLKTMQAANQVAGAHSQAVSMLSDNEKLESVSDLPVRARGSRARGSTSSVDASRGVTAAGAGMSSHDSGRLRILRRKLLDFLRSSTSYTAEKMLSRFPRHLLLEERAILLARISQHELALNIYAHRLHDPLQAEAYAEEHYAAATAAMHAAHSGAIGAAVQHGLPGGVSAVGVGGGVGGGVTAPSALVGSLSMGAGHIAEGRDMYLKLLQVYLKPPPLEPAERQSNVLASVARGAAGGSAVSTGSADSSTPSAPAPMLDAALLLLSKYFDRISPVGALESLPPSTPLQALQPYFEKLMCHTVHQQRDEQITKQLLRAENLAVKEHYLLASRGRVCVDSSTTCSRCHKKLGNSAFARYPNDAIVHYVCHQQTISMQAQNAILPKGDL